MIQFIFILRLLLGGLFFLSGFAKISFPGSRALDPHMVEVFSVFHFIPLELIHFYVELVPWVLLVLAVGLVIGTFLKIVSAVSIFFISSFLFANLLFAYYGFSDHCPKCFGELLELKLPHAIGIDLLMLVAAVWIFLKGTPGISLNQCQSRTSS